MFDINGFGIRVREARMRMDISQKKLSRDLGVSDDYISKVERGVMMCSPDMIVALAVYLNVSTDYLLMGGGPGLQEKVNLLNELLTEAMDILRRM